LARTQKEEKERAKAVEEVRVEFEGRIEGIMEKKQHEQEVY